MGSILTTVGILFSIYSDGCGLSEKDPGSDPGKIPCCRSIFDNQVLPTLASDSINLIFENLFNIFCYCNSCIALTFHK